LKNEKKGDKIKNLDQYEKKSGYYEPRTKTGFIADFSLGLIGHTENMLLSVAV
jgi:hypothetical protein